MADLLSPRWISVPGVTQLTRCPSLATSCFLFVDLELQNACQGQPNTAPTFLPALLSLLGHTRMWGTEFQLLGAIRGKVKVLKDTNPTASGTLGLQKACQGEHGTAPTLLHPHLSQLGQPWMWGHESKD